MKNIYELDLHEGLHIEGVQSLTIIRVPGGWIYTAMRLDCNAMNSVFVPYDNGFSPDRFATR